VEGALRAFQDLEHGFHSVKGEKHMAQQRPVSDDDYPVVIGLAIICLIIYFIASSVSISG